MPQCRAAAPTIWRQEGLLFRGLAMGLAVLLVQGCTGSGAGYSRVRREAGRGGGLVNIREGRGEAALASAEEERSLARQAEVEVALGQMWAVAREVDAQGDRLKFVFWSQRGALTLLSWHRAAEGRGEVLPVERKALARPLRTLFELVAEGRIGAMCFTLQREREGWRVDYDAATVAEPAERRLWPSPRVRSAAETLAVVQAMASTVELSLRAPTSGVGQVTLEVQLEDDRLLGWRQREWSVQPGGTVRCTPTGPAEALEQSLLPFTRALGPRVVRLRLAGAEREGSSSACWRVESAETLRPLPPPAEQMDLVREYRALHADIFYRYELAMEESVQMAASFTLEQVALWVTGGLVGKGLQVAYKAVAPTVVKVLSAGGKHVAGWFRTLLIRAGKADQELLRQLWLKVEIRGLESLTVRERDMLLGLMRRLEQTLAIPLSTGVKEELRRQDRVRFYREFPELAEVLVNQRGALYDVHHLVPLEYAHLFSFRDINAIDNLVAVARPVHEGVGRIWTTIRTSHGGRMRPSEVEGVEAIVRRHFSRWYNRPLDATASALERLAAAERAALEEIKQLLLQPGRRP